MNYYGVTRSNDHLAHYGVKGMKWGVRRALARGSQKALSRQYRKASKKLNKLYDKGLNSGKYAKRAAAYGVAAIGTGTLAVGGTKLTGKILEKIGKGVTTVGYRIPTFTSGRPGRVNINPKDSRGTNYNTLPKGYGTYKAINDIKTNIKNAGFDIQEKATGLRRWGGKQSSIENPFDPIRDKEGNIFKNPITNKNMNKHFTNDQLYRAGAGVATLGLGVASGVNAYRATHGKKYREKAVSFKNAMDEAFKGTPYSGSYVVPKRKRKRG